jgi:hypothetical protein
MLCTTMTSPGAHRAHKAPIAGTVEVLSARFVFEDAVRRHRERPQRIELPVQVLVDRRHARVPVHLAFRCLPFTVRTRTFSHSISPHLSLCVPP